MLYKELGVCTHELRFLRRFLLIERRRVYANGSRIQESVGGITWDILSTRSWNGAYWSFRRFCIPCGAVCHSFIVCLSASHITGGTHCTCQHPKTEGQSTARLRRSWTWHAFSMSFVQNIGVNSVVCHTLQLRIVGTHSLRPPNVAHARIKI